MTLEERIEKMEQDLKEMKQELENKETKQHKSLSDYRVYEEYKLKDGEHYKFLNNYSEITEGIWSSDDFDIAHLKKGNIYSINTPNELLEREIKKRQLWFNLEKHLKENNCLATSEDWAKKGILKYCVHFDYFDKKFIIAGWECKKHNIIYSTDEEVLKNYMNTLSEEDIKIMFDVE